MANDASAGLKNRNFFWLWFVGVLLASLLATLWVGRWGLIAPLVGVVGAFLALLFAKPLAIRSHRIRLINPMNPRSEMEQALVGLVAKMATNAGLKHAPAVGIYESPELNAFTTGANEKGALIAFTDRLLNEMPLNEVRAVAAHEVGHIANRDMFAVVLLQGAVSAVVLFFLAPLVFIHFLWKSLGDQTSSSAWLIDAAFAALKVAVGVALTAVGVLLVRAFSRRRELRADLVAARLCGSDSMLAALRRLDRDIAVAPKSQLGYATFKIVGRSALGEFFSTHPSYERRVRNLGGHEVAIDPTVQGAPLVITQPAD